MKLLLSLCLLSICFCAPSFSGVYTEIHEWAQVPNGTHYPTAQPLVIPGLFEGKKVAILVSHLAEDCLVYYQYDYFAKRGAEIDILSDGGGPIYIADFIKPTYMVNTTKLTANTLKNTYDIIYIPGGAHSSSLIRASDIATQLIWQHYRASKFIAAICSGTEVLIEAGLAQGRHLTGSPTSRDVLTKAGAIYHGVPTVIEGNVLTGLGATYSMQFVDQITNYFRKDAPTGVANDETEIDPRIFVPLKTPEDVPLGQFPHNDTQPPLVAEMYANKRVAILVSHALQQSAVRYVDRYFTERHARVDILGIFKQTVLHHNSRPYYLLDTNDISKYVNEHYDVVVVPGGSLWSSVVMANNIDYTRLIWSAYSRGAVIGGGGTGIDVLGAAGILRNVHITGCPFCKKNVEDVGAIFHPGIRVTRDPSAAIVTAVSYNDMFEFCESISREFADNGVEITMTHILCFVTISANVMLIILLVVAILLQCMTYRSLRSSQEPYSESLLRGPTTQ